MLDPYKKAGYYIYYLADDKGELRYIGQTSKSLDLRLNRHICDALRVDQESGKFETYQRSSVWIRHLNNRSCLPKIYLLQQLNNKDDLNDAEIYWIKYFKDQGCRLVNTTDGGLGQRGTLPTKEHRRNISLNRGLDTPIWCPQTGKIYNSIARAAEEIGVEGYRVQNILHGRSKTTGLGYQFFYIDEITDFSKKPFPLPHKNVAHRLSTKKREVWAQKGTGLFHFNSLTEAERATGADHSLISACLNGKRKSTKGYVFFATEPSQISAYTIPNKKIKIYCIDDRKTFNSLLSAAKHYGVTSGAISSSIKENRTCIGKKFKKIEDGIQEVKDGE